MIHFSNGLNNIFLFYDRYSVRKLFIGLAFADLIACMLTVIMAIVKADSPAPMKTHQLI